jgi:3-methylcrotonyl-CoA carboxylase alpha subunit
MSDPKVPFPAALTIDDTAYETLPTRKFLARKPYAAPDPKKVLCFIPGIIRKIYVRPGQHVTRGEHLFILEAMKMQNDISAPADGVVKSVLVEIGLMVTKGQALLELE